MTTFAVAMLATPRKTLPRSIAGLRHGGIHEPIHLFAEPGEILSGEGLTVHHSSRRLGLVANAKRALEWLRDCTAVDHVILCEDDIDCCRGLRDRLEQVIALGYDVAHGCTFRREVKRKYVQHNVEGWQKHTGTCAWGTQLVMWRYNVLARMLDTLRWPSENLGGGLDLAMTGWATDMGMRRLMHNPSLVDHVCWDHTTLTKKPQQLLPKTPRQWRARQAFRFNRDYV